MTVKKRKRNKIYRTMDKLAKDLFPKYAKEHCVHCGQKNPVKEVL